LPKLRAAVIGCGDVATVHFEALAAMDNVEIVAVVGPTEGRRRQAAERWGIPDSGVFADTATMLAQIRPDIVHVATPHAAHVEPVLAAIAAGADVIVEKPLAHTVSDALRIVEAAERAKVRVGVCFQNRYNATSVELRRLLDTGELGPLLGASASVRWFRPASYFAAAPWRGTWSGSGGGVLMNQAIHTLDLLLWLLGDAQSVTGGVGQRALAGHIEVEDTADLSIEHASGVRSTLFATNAAALNFPVQLEIHGERGRAILGRDLVIEIDGAAPRTVSEVTASGAGRSYWGASHEALIRDFYAGHGSGEPFWISPRQALGSLQAIKDVYRGSLPAGVWI